MTFNINNITLIIFFIYITFSLGVLWNGFKQNNLPIILIIKENMKLVEIKDVRIGQIYKNHDKYYVLAKNTSGYKYAWNMIEFSNDFNILKNICTDANPPKDAKLVGFLNITHKIEDNKLVEIPREEFEVDDVIKLNDNKEYVISALHSSKLGKVDKVELLNTYSSNYFGSATWIMENIFMSDIKEKTGTLGITHEFINSKLGESNETN